MIYSVLIMCLILAFVSVASANLLSDAEYQTHFTTFVRDYQKTYKHDEMFYKFATFKKNLIAILEHNADESNTFQLAINEFADMPNEEFFKTMASGLRNKDNSYFRSLNTRDETTGDNPDSLDWVANGAVTPIKNQGQCGSCWAFSTTGSVEGANFLKTGTLQSFSEQQLVDCSGSEGNMGCNGGLMDDAFQWIIKNGGICLESDYPYKAVVGSCQTSCQEQGTVSSFVDVKSGDEDDLMAKIQIAPVSIAIDASSMSFQLYSGGVYTKKCGQQLDHGVLLVGYGTLDGVDYWKVKNSWGESWGMDGYILLERGINDCGLSNAASQPTA